VSRDHLGVAVARARIYLRQALMTDVAENVRPRLHRLTRAAVQRMVIGRWGIHFGIAAAGRAADFRDRYQRDTERDLVSVHVCCISVTDATVVALSLSPALAFFNFTAVASCA